MSVVRNLVRQALLLVVSASVALIPVLLVGAIAQVRGLVQIKGWYAHGNFILLAVPGRRPSAQIGRAPPPPLIAWGGARDNRCTTKVHHVR